MGHKNFTEADRELRRQRMRKLLTKHGHAAAGKKSATYKAWEEMRSRCHRPAHNSYHWYGGQGIRVCERWNLFENFLADMGEKPEGMTLDRFPNRAGDYEPGNCRWATMLDQQNNRRDNVRVTFKGRSFTAAELAREAGLDPGLVQERLRRGLSPEQAALPPADSKFKRRAP